MTPSVLRDISQEFLLLSAAHHLALAVIAVIFWIRRKSMGRTVDVYFAFAFGTAAFALFTRPETRIPAAASTLVAALWLRDTVRPRNVFSFERTPRPRLVVMGAAALFALAYPGYSGDLPSLVFSPLGVVLPPTLIVATAVVNSAAPTTNRALHWALAAIGLAVGLVGIVVEGWIHAPLLVVSLYAVPLVLGRGKQLRARDASPKTSVRELRSRMYSRKTLLPGPRDPRRGRRSTRRRIR